jgi:GNAT superfamily N-acetyltransferase
MITINPVRSSQELMRFIRLPWKIYNEDPHWVPPLISDQRRILSRFVLTSHNQLQCLFLAEKGGHSIGRLALFIDTTLNMVKGSSAGYFSLFECLNDEEVAGRLFETAARWLQQRGIKILKGPVSPGGLHEDECKGLLVDGFNRPPVFMTSYNSSYYKSLIEGCAFKKDFDMYAYLLERDRFFARHSATLIEYASRRYGFRLEKVDFDKFEREIRDFKRVLDLAIPTEWPLMIAPSIEEIRAIANRLMRVADQDFVVIVRTGDEAIGFAAALPDYNQVFIHMNGRLTPLGLLKYFYYKRKITCLRVFVIFVVPAFRKKGVSHAIYYHIFKHFLAKGYRHAEGSTIGEQNVDMRKDIESIGGQRYKTYRIYQKVLGT